ncbi:MULTISPECIES: hypothetical protein [Bradyrhizobium]|jgi:hypothetical protein|nr:hypothetical protein [Bradyrhizobium erythrophlei]
MPLDATIARVSGHPPEGLRPTRLRPTRIELDPAICNAREALSEED